MARHALPTGTVTFLFTDVEGSTLLLEQLGKNGYAEALQEHRRLIREAGSASAAPRTREPRLTRFSSYTTMTRPEAGARGSLTGIRRVGFPPASW